MPYIYKITNQINGKSYIGKTLFSIEERWKEHCKDCRKEHYEKRPLYAAMNKYGVQSFSIEQIEECTDDILNDREKYWIEYYGTFKNGYNATLGGDGRAYIDYDLVVATYRELKSIKDTASKLGIDAGYTGKILKMRNESIIDQALINRVKLGHPVNQYDLQGNYIQTFPSVKNAAISLGKLKNYADRGCISHISDVCKGKRKTAYGYIWKYAEIDQPMDNSLKK